MIGSVVHYKGAEEDQAGFLRRRRVGPARRSKYLHAAGLFRAFCRERRLALAAASEVDHALDLYLVQLSAKQRLPLQQAREAFYGVRLPMIFRTSTFLSPMHPLMDIKGKILTAHVNRVHGRWRRWQHSTPWSIARRGKLR